jgi:hypothetical protein
MKIIYLVVMWRMAEEEATEENENREEINEENRRK